MIGIIEQNGNPVYGIYSYILDAPEDLENLPRKGAPGSTALVASTGNIYILNNQREWVQL